MLSSRRNIPGVAIPGDLKAHQATPTATPTVRIPRSIVGADAATISGVVNETKMRKDPHVATTAHEINNINSAGFFSNFFISALLVCERQLAHWKVLAASRITLNLMVCQ
jgi:hypothetical protein